MSKIFIEIILILALILLNGYFSLAEIALLSVKKSRLRHLSKLGNKRAQNALFLTRKSSEMLSAIQIGISMIGIFAGAFGAATLSHDVAKLLTQSPWVIEYSEPISVVIIIVVTTFLSLVIGELVPKQIALSNPERISLLVARQIKFIMTVTSPLVKILSNSTGAVLKVLRIKPAIEHTVSEEEIKLLIAEGAESGVFERSEQKMVESIFHLGNRPIKDFMTARKEVKWIDVFDSPEIVRDKIAGSDRSVFPVCDGNIDNNLGAIETKDLLVHLFDNGAEHFNLKSLIQPVMHINSDVPSLVAIERLKRSSISIVLITEKHSQKVVGIISFHDILEEIIGEFKSA
ncbi:MAG: hemolysin family protein [Candidatus Magasanikbacteria bacterium]|nr:hemolysin family protein [Candidatus Magasanikbacteria bacterium]